MKLLSIVIPSFNMEDYLPKNLSNLVKAKNINEVEVIVVNDGSTDNTLNIAKEYEKECHSVKIIDKANGHYGSCINAALKVATGKYYRILDADDWFETEDLDFFIEKLRDCDADLVVTLRTECWLMRDGSWKKERYPIEGIQYYNPYDARHFDISQFSKSVEFNMHSMTYKTEILRRANLLLPHGICYTDLIYCMVPLNIISDLVVFDIYLYNYFTGREGSSTAGDSLRKNISHICKVLDILMTYFENNPASTQSVRNNQLRYVTEATHIMTESLLKNRVISKDVYHKMIEPIRRKLFDIGIKNKKLQKYYMRNWYRKGGYYRLIFGMFVYRVLH